MNEEHPGFNDAWREAHYLAIHDEWDALFDRLRQGDVDVNAYGTGNYHGLTLLSIAIRHHNLAASYQLLTELHADVNVQDEDGVTALHHVVNRYESDFDQPSFRAEALTTALLLLTAGADPLLKAYGDSTPYDWSLNHKKKPKMRELSELLKTEERGFALTWETDADGKREGLSVEPLSKWRGRAEARSDLKHVETPDGEAAIIAGMQGVHVVSQKEGRVTWRKLAPHWLEFWQAARQAQAEHPSHALYVIDLERVPADELIDRPGESRSLMPALHERLTPNIGGRYEFLQVAPEMPAPAVSLGWRDRMRLKMQGIDPQAEHASLAPWLEQQAGRTGSGVYRMEAEPAEFFAQAEAVDGMPPPGEAQARLVAARNAAGAAAARF